VAVAVAAEAEWSLCKRDAARFAASPCGEPAARERREPVPVLRERRQPVPVAREQQLLVQGWLAHGERLQLRALQGRPVLAHVLPQHGLAVPAEERPELPLRALRV